MEKSQHTPGPWVVETTSGMNIYITQPQDMPNRTPGFYAEVRRFTSSVDAVKANARLIAAAPDLLEALEKIAVLYEKDIDADNYEQAANAYEMRCIARAAITKAKGETQ